VPAVTRRSEPAFRRALGLAFSSGRIKLPGDELYEINDHTRGTT